MATEASADLVIIDERLGRRHAARLGLALTGVLGVLLKAKERGFLREIKPLILQLREGGIYLSEDIIKETLVLARE